MLSSSGRWPRVGALAALAFLMMSEAVGASPTAAVRQAPDLQSWDELDVSARLLPQLDATWVSQTRFSQAAPNPSVFASGLDLNVSVNPNLIITPSYYYIGFRSRGTSWAHTDTPILAVTALDTWGAWTLSNRARVAGIFGDGASYWIFLDRPRIDVDLGRGKWGSSVFVWDEFSYYSFYSGWTRNRVAAGWRVGLTREAALDIYGVHQNDRQAHPHQIDGLGITLEWRIR